ncbi:unnamed protein product [Durusdinium trenchii]|uniref:Uncharacterized protein n=1 Tax=Durusdinium trenchii TaxID=1381693 RepID=A0ABP0KXC4_9DINO
MFLQDVFPGESRCETLAAAKRPPGAECYYDQDCDGPFSRCLQRVCRRALLTHQSCSVSDENDLCVTGQRLCFRGHCAGLESGAPCSAQVEGADIDCNLGWYCFLGVCTPQLPVGHTCTGLHSNECLGGYRCNLALDIPRCLREFSLALGATSSTGRLCMSNHVDPIHQECATLPDVVTVNGKPTVSGRDCLTDSECLRPDNSLGRCLCKQWWEGAGTAGYCELSELQVWKPAFKRFWEAAIVACHHDWSEERCAAEIGLEEVLATVRRDSAALSSDPTEIKSCATELLETWDFNGLHRGAHALLCLPLLVQLL